MQTILTCHFCHILNNSKDLHSSRHGISHALYSLMFKTMKQKDLIKEVERNGFTLIRNGEHKVFQRDNVTIMIPHSKVISPGLVHQTYKALKRSA